MGLSHEQFEKLALHMGRMVDGPLTRGCMEWRKARRSAHLKRLDASLLAECSDERCAQIRKELLTELEELECIMEEKKDTVMNLSKCIIEPAKNGAGFKSVDIFDTTHTYRMNRLHELEKLAKGNNMTIHNRLEKMLIELEEQEFMDTYEVSRSKREVEEKDLKERTAYVRKRKSVLSSLNPMYQKYMR